MAYPDEVTASVIEIGGNSCGTLQGLMRFDTTATPPEYYLVEGDFAYARLWRIDTGGQNYTWQLKVYAVSGTCVGLHNFRLTQAADDPVGDYCYFADDQIDCSMGKAGVVEA